MAIELNNCNCNGKRSVLTHALNLSGLGIWLLMTLAILLKTSGIESIYANQLAYGGLVSFSTCYGIFSLIAGVILVDLFTPYFKFEEMFSGDGSSKIAGAITFAGILYAIAKVISAAN
ncbi:MAG: DUF350 domain-containing protein [Desulfomonile tiedjei]|nr:DUF350 domain-containing protein [Desulfomonile tiedjei]